MSKEKILVIDDEPIICDVVSEILTLADFRVSIAPDGQTGYERIRESSVLGGKEEPFDLIITDIKMPRLGGMELIAKIRKNISTDLPVMVMTGHGTIDIAIESLKQGTQGFVMKPFTPGEIVSAVKEVLKKSAIIKENIKLKAFLPLFEMNKRLLTELNIKRLFRITLEESARYTNADQAALAWMEEDGTLKLELTEGSDKETGKWEKITKNKTLTEWIALEKKVVLLQENLEMAPPLREIMRNDDIKSMCCIPFVSKGNLLGILFLEKTTSARPFSISDMELVSILCGQAGIAIENAQLYEKVKKSYIGIITTLASAIEARDYSTANHTAKMVEFVFFIAMEMGLTGEILETIQVASLLHDIGKIGIPDQILFKKDSLSIDESQVMRGHAEVGAKILDNLTGMEEISQIVKHHHEYFDGSGYPSKLSGMAIPLGSRIIGVADSYEAMTSQRPYQQAISPGEAAIKLKDMSGIQFDPKIVDIFINVLERKKMI